MDYKEKVIALLNSQELSKEQKEKLENIFPELKETEDEKIRKVLVGYFKSYKEVGTVGAETFNEIPTDNIIAWLEKQTNTSNKEYVFRPLAGDTIEKAAERAVELGGKVVLAFNGAYIPVGSKTKDEIVAEYRNWFEKQSEQSVEPKWCHHKVDLSDCSEEYRRAYYDGWNNCNMQYSQYKSELDDVTKCLINGMKFYYEGNKEATWGTDKWSMPVKHIIEVLEKQSEQTHATKTSDQELEPKFHPGDWITNGQLTCKVLGVVGKSYELHLYNDNYCHFETDVQSVDEDYRLWTIADAKNGDVLVASDGSIFLFAGVDDCACKYYVALTTDNYVKINKNAKGGYWETSRAVYPATKEQRELLFQNMKEAGWELDNGKKELKKIEVVSNESEDERIRKELIEQVAYIIPNDDEVDSEGDALSTYQKRIDKYRAWLEKQGNMLNSDKVIEWLRKNTCAACWDNPDEGVSQCIEQFKKDFEICHKK